MAVSMGTTAVVGEVVIGTVVAGAIVVGTPDVTGIEVDGREEVVGAEPVPDALFALLSPQAVRARLEHAVRTQSTVASRFIRLPRYERRPSPSVRLPS